MKVSTVYLAGLALLTLVGCEQQETASVSTASEGEGEGQGEVLASVGGQQVGSVEFEQSASRKSPEDGNALSQEEKQEVLDRLVDEKLLYIAALERELDKDPKVQKVMINTLLREVVYADVRNSDFTDEQLQAYYDAHIDEFVVPEKVQIRRILLKVGDDENEDDVKAQANEVQAEVVAAPDSFKEIAAKNSEGPYRRRGGDVGFVPETGKPGLDPLVVKRAFEMTEGEISEAFKTTDGYNIVMVANRRERVERTFQQMKGSVLRKVKNEHLKKLYDDYVSDLRTKTEVKVNQDQLDGIEIKSMRRPMGPGFSLNPALEGSQPSGTMEVVDGTKGLSLPALTPPTPAPSPSVEN